MTDCHTASRQAKSRSAPHLPELAWQSRLLTSPLLSDEERQALVNAASPAKMVKANVDLVREGEPTDSLFILIDGWACRYATTREGGRQFPALLVSGDIANLDTLMFERLDYGARTLTAATVVTMARDRAAALTMQYPGIARTFTWLAMIENVTLSRWILSLGRRSAKQRLAHLLCELSVRLQARSEGGNSLDFPLRQEHLADALGLTPVHVNRTMRQLRADGLIEIENRVLTFPDFAQLENMGGFDRRYLRIDTELGCSPSVPEER